VNLRSDETMHTHLPRRPPDSMIVGVGRSGTTLLMAMLNAHPDLVVVPETHFFRRFVVRNRLLTHQQAIQLLGEDTLFRRVNLEPRLIVNPIDSVKGRVDWTAAYERMLAEYARGHGGRRIVDKDPRAVECLHVLHRTYPTLKILHMIRDPRDVFLSRKRAKWSEGRNWLTQAMTYRVQFAIGRLCGRQLRKDLYKEVFYEELLTHPEGTMREVSQFLGIPYCPDMLGFSEKAKQIVASDEVDWKRNVMGPLLSNNFEKWRQDLDRREIVRIESVCRSAFGKGLYERSALRLRFGEAVESGLLRVIAASASFVYLFYKLGMEKLTWPWRVAMPALAEIFHVAVSRTMRLL